MILVVGGTGNLGEATTRRLRAQGIAVRVMTREPEKASELHELGAEVVRGDLVDKNSLTRACRGVTKVLAAAHSLLGRGSEASKYVDLQGHKDLIDVANAAGVEHFVYTSAVFFNAQYDSISFLQMKRAVEQYLTASGLSYTILRPTNFMESHAEALIGMPILESGKVPLFGKGENPRNFVAADDVAQFAVLALHDDNLRGKTIDVGGPENLTNQEVVRIYGGLAGKRAKVSHIPLPMIKLMSYLVRPFNPPLSMIMRSAIYADTTDCTFDPAEMMAIYPIRPITLQTWAAQRIAARETAPSLV